MQTWLTYALYGVIAILVIVLAIGILNLTRTDAKAASRSNKLMRLRIVAQFAAIVVIMAVLFLSGR